METRYAIVEAPSNLGLAPTGVDTLPEALLRAGLIDRLAARHAGRVVPRHAYDDRRDRANGGTLNAIGIATYAADLANAVGAVLDAGERPLVLGGDCSILLGPLLALRRRGRHGLLFLDGHADFYQPEANPNGQAASMELAFATGRGPDVVANLEGRRPLVADVDVVAFGFRDAAEQAAYGSQPLPPEMLAFDLLEVRRAGVEAVARQSLAHLTRPGGAGRFWLHVDADVLDDAIMPAVDYRQPDGLSWHELLTVVRAAHASDALVGLDVTIYNPALDRDGAGARGLVDMLAGALV
jgi:arginase